VLFYEPDDLDFAFDSEAVDTTFGPTDTNSYSPNDLISGWRAERRPGSSQKLLKRIQLLSLLSSYSCEA